MGYVYVSGWAHGAEPGGIGIFRFNEEDGEMEFVRAILEDVSFGVSLLDSEKKLLYALNEVADLRGMRTGGGGSIYTFRLLGEGEDLELLDVTPTYCPNPAYLCKDASEKYLLVANHSGKQYVTKIKKTDEGKYIPSVEFDDSAVELFNLEEDGRIGELLDVQKHIGTGPHGRQTHPHPHSVVMAPNGKFFIVCDKGNDHLYAYRIIEKEGNAELDGRSFMTMPAAMPRYGVFHPAKAFFYHNNEGAPFICRYSYSEDGELIFEEKTICMPEDKIDPERGKIEQQGLCIDETGNTLYDVINGQEVVSVFRIDPECGKLTNIQVQDVGYKWARGASITPDGKFLIVTCLKGQKTVVFAIAEDGTLKRAAEADYQNAAWAVTYKE